LIEINAEGRVVKRIPLPETEQNVHLQIRVARKDMNGHYWVAYLGDGIVYAVDAAGKIIHRINVAPDHSSKHRAFEALPLENGNVLVSGAGTGKVSEYTPDGQVAWEIGPDELPGIKLNWIAGIERLPNNNTVICDWGNGQSEVKALEVTREKKIVWQLTNPSFEGISRIHVIPADYCPVASREIY
jgi:hypothetical protein